MISSVKGGAGSLQATCMLLRFNCFCKSSSGVVWGEVGGTEGVCVSVDVKGAATASGVCTKQAEPCLPVLLPECRMCNSGDPWHGHWCVCLCVQSLYVFMHVCVCAWSLSGCPSHPLPSVEKLLAECGGRRVQTSVLRANRGCRRGWPRNGRSRAWPGSLAPPIFPSHPFFHPISALDQFLSGDDWKTHRWSVWSRELSLCNYTYTNTLPLIV